jgi:hypothetical protein
VGAVSSKLAEKRAKIAGQQTFGGAPLLLFENRQPASHFDPKIITSHQFKETCETCGLAPTSADWLADVFAECDMKSLEQLFVMDTS